MAISKTSRAQSLKALGGANMLPPEVMKAAGQMGRKVKPAGPKMPKNAHQPMAKKKQPATNRFSAMGAAPKPNR